MSRRAWALAGAGALAVHALLLLLYHLPEPKALSGDERIYWEVALRLSQGLEARMPPFWPPLQAHLLAAWLRVMGGSLLAFQLFQTGLLVLAAGLARALVLRWTGWGLAADVTALWMLAFPPLVAYAHYLWPEVVHLVLLLGAAWMVTAHGQRAAGAAAAGALAGVAVLTKSLVAPLLPLLLVPLAWRGSWPVRLSRCAAAALALLLVLAPIWADAERRALAGGLGGSGWFNLFVGLQDTRRDDPELPVVQREFVRFQLQPGSFAERSAALRRESFELVRERGLLSVLQGQLSKQYFRLFDKESFLTEQLPGGPRAERGEGYAAAPPWLAAGLRGVSHVSYALLLVTASAGLVLAVRRAPPWVWAPLLFLAYNLLLFLVLHVKTRYRVPILPVLFLFSGVAVQWMVEWRRGAGEARAALGVPSPLAAALAALIAVLLLLLAFGRPLLG